MMLLVFAFAAALAAPPSHTIRVPLPTTRVSDTLQDSICLLVPLTPGDTSSRSGLPSFDVDCVVAGDWMRVCITLTASQWPDEVPDIVCGQEDATRVRMRPVKAFDPLENIWDGVGLLQTVHAFGGMFRVDHPDAPGVMNHGVCGIRGGIFSFETTNDARQQACHLVMADGSERTVPIRLRPKVGRVGR